MLAPAGYQYQIGRDYVATVSYGGGNEGYDWWLNAAVQDDGRVIKAGMDPAEARAQLDAADAVDGDEDSDVELMVGLVTEWEVRYAALDRGESRPPGPMLAAVFKEAGIPVSEPAQSLEESLDAFVDTPAEYRVFPTDNLEADGFVDGIQQSLGVPLVQMEAMVLHDDAVDDAASLGL
jgi:hypothetical protein